MDNMKKRWLYIALLVPFITGLIIGSFKDLEIANAVFIGTDFASNPFGTLMSAFAPIISYLFIAFCSGYFLHFAINEKEDKKIKVHYWGIAIAAYIASIYFTGHKIITINAFNYPQFTVPSFILCALILAPVVYFGYRIGKAKENKIFLRAVLAIFVLYAIALVPSVQIPKLILRRPRYRALISGTYESYGVTFLNWWQPNTWWNSIKADFAYNLNFSEEFKSFPSAHTSEAALTAVSLPYLCFIDEKLRKNEHWLCFGGLLFTFIMGYSRMTMGAHFLSDCSAGALIVTILFIITNEVNHRFIIKESSVQTEK